MEDEKELVDYLPSSLKGKGLEVIGTTSIDQALEWLTQESFDAVLLDIMMPPAENMNAEQLDYGRETGVEVARRMKVIKPEVPIVAFTVLTDPEIRAKVLAAGVTRILNKPIEPEQIAEVLLQVSRLHK